MFTANPSTKPQGFNMKFSNGYDVSVQWGAGNYCQNRWRHQHESKPNTASAEVMLSRGREIVRDGAGVFDTRDGVAGWVCADEVARILYEVSQLENPDA